MQFRKSGWGNVTQEQSTLINMEQSQQMELQPQTLLDLEISKNFRS